MKKERNPLPLKYRLLLWIIPIVFIYTWVLTAINSGYIMQSTRNSLEKTLGETVQITSEHIADSIENNQKLAMLLASQVGAQYEAEITMPYAELNVEAFAARIAAIGVNYGFLHMMVAGPDGYTRTLVHTNLREVKADYYLAIVDEKKPCYVSDVSLDQGSFKGKYVLNYSAPIKNANGNVIGVLICKADAEELSALVTKISVGDQGSTFIMDNRGQCIAHQDAKMLFGGETYAAFKDNATYPTLNALWDTMSQQQSGYMTYDYVGGQRLAAFSRVDGTNNWSIAVTVAENEFMQDAIRARSTATWIGLCMIVIACLILLFLFRFVTKSVLDVTARLEKLAEGDLSTEIVLNRSSEETYRLSQAAAKLCTVLKSLIGETRSVLDEIAAGNLTASVAGEYPGDFSRIRDAIETNLVKLNGLVRRISRTSEEVARGSAQMASGASGLAQGASEQASSLEELFETVTSLAHRTYEIGGLDKMRLATLEEENEGADENEATDRKIDSAETLAEKLTISISRIAEASGTIRRIASDIESISSETGMLALNASVEATHAGEAGRGFSVIAAEIRSLSDKSRDAAKDADEKIDSITRAVSRGSQTVELTVSTIGEMSLAVEQVKGALEQISNVVENIAATAEETAAGSEELSAQADLLKSLVAEFKYHEAEETV